MRASVDREAALSAWSTSSPLRCAESMPGNCATDVSGTWGRSTSSLNLLAYCTARRDEGHL